MPLRSRKMAWADWIDRLSWIINKESPKDEIQEEEPRKEEPLNAWIQPTARTGFLDPGSQTWAFVSSWAHEHLQKARVKNDNINRDIIQTSVLRGEIKVLKELINLPNPKEDLSEET